MPARQFISLVLGNIAAETESTVVLVLLRQLATTLSLYVDAPGVRGGDHARRRHSVAAHARRQRPAATTSCSSCARSRASRPPRRSSTTWRRCSTTSCTLRTCPSTPTSHGTSSAGSWPVDAPNEHRDRAAAQQGRHGIGSAPRGARSRRAPRPPKASAPRGTRSSTPRRARNCPTRSSSRRRRASTARSDWTLLEPYVDEYFAMLRPPTRIAPTRRRRTSSRACTHRSSRAGARPAGEGGRVARSERGRARRAQAHGDRGS